MSEREMTFDAALASSRARYEAQRDAFNAAMSDAKITPEARRAGQELALLFDHTIDYVSALLMKIDAQHRQLMAMLDPGDLPFDGEAG